jgi:hypothetical protein
MGYVKHSVSIPGVFGVKSFDIENVLNTIAGKLGGKWLGSKKAGRPGSWEARKARKTCLDVRKPKY